MYFLAVFERDLTVVDLLRPAQNLGRPRGLDSLIRLLIQTGDELTG